MQADRIDEEDKSKVVGKMCDIGLDMDTQSRDGNADEKHPSNAKREMTDTRSLTEPKAQRNNQRQHQDRLGDGRGKEK